MSQPIPEIDALEVSLATMQPIRAAIVRLLDALADFIRHNDGISPADRARLTALATGFNAETNLLDEAVQRNLDVDPGATGATGSIG